MALQDTSQQLHELLETLLSDLPKAIKGNKAASQRVRTRTVVLEKVGKKYRKESMHREKKRS